MLTYNSRLFTEQTWPDFKTFVRLKARELGAPAWATCLEKSLNAQGQMPVWHMHAYFFWDNKDGVKLRNTDTFVFQTVKPRVDCCAMTNPSTFKRSALHGLWYACVMKTGTIEAATTCIPWKHYTPDAAWLTSLWGAGKLTHKEFEELSAEFRVGRRHM